MKLSKSTTAFLACHWENDVVGSDGAFAPFYRARLEEHDVIPIAKRLIDGARWSGVRVVYTRAAGIDTVVLFGVATNLSVESTGRSAGDLGYRVVIVPDACEAATDQAHAATLASFALLGEVATADEVLAAL